MALESIIYANNIKACKGINMKKNQNLKDHQDAPSGNF